MKTAVLADLSIEVPPEEVQRAVNKAFAALSKKARIRGFRQGKAPRAVLKRMFGEAVLNEVRGDIINDSLLAAFVEHDLSPVSQPEIDAPPLSSEETGYSFTTSFEVRPKLEQINYDGIELERGEISVQDSEVEDELTRIRSSMASVNDLESPRSAATGDAATISLRRLKDGNLEESGLNDQQVVIGDGHAPKAVEDALLGMNVGDEKTVDLRPDTEKEEDRIRYLLKLTGLKERKLPELDDELAKDTGGYDTLDALKEDIRKRILDGKNRNEDRRLQVALYDALRLKNPMDLPPTLVSRQTEMLKNQLYRGVMNSFDKNSEEGAVALKTMEEGLAKTAEEMVHRQLLMVEISRLSNIKVEDEDVDAEIAKRAEEMGLPLPMVRAEMNKGNHREDLMVQILETKIFDFAKTLVKITDVKGNVTLAEKLPESSGDKSVEEEDKKPKAKGTAKKARAEKTEDTGETANSEDKAPVKKTAAKKTAEESESVSDKSAQKKTSTKKAAGKKAPAEK
jgi:trigger factor